jgi:arsenite transporter
MFGRVLLLASRGLFWLIPVSICSGVISGSFFDFDGFKPLILPMVMLLIYPSMIGINLKSLLRSSHIKLILATIVVNFTIIPLGAYGLGIAFLQKTPGLFAGLSLASLLPTSSMTLTYTVLAGGNLPGALKTTILSLLLGSCLSPFYLFFLIGQYIPFNIEAALKTLTLIILLPMVAGVTTFQIIKKFITVKKFEISIAPYLPGFSAILSATIIFFSVGMESRTILSNPNMLFRCVAVQTAFYLMNYLISIITSKVLNLGNQDGLALVYSTVLRNLAISIGMAASMFGSEAALMVSLAFLIQPIAAAWFMKINTKWHLLGA